MNYTELESAVIAWSQARKIIPRSTPTAQLMKAFSEMGELADATLKYDMAGCIDGVGDVLVCLTNYCALQGVTMTQCFAAAYEQIKDRRGELLESGVFVKE